MRESLVSSIPLPRFNPWDKIKNKRALISFNLEITARCNNNCRHCCINLPAGDQIARKKEISFAEIKRITDAAVSMGALWCLITGGEPLLREDFFDIYFYLKKKGLLVSIFTNATLITKEHIRIFTQYPPRSIEVSVYGVTEKTYEKVTRRPGGFGAFRHGFDLLRKNNLHINLKATAINSNVDELSEIASFCRRHTGICYRFDPLLHLRFDGNVQRNKEIRQERLSPEKIVAIERADKERAMLLKEHCNQLIALEVNHRACHHLFHCGAGNGSFTVSYDGFFRLCPPLWHPECLYDLSKGTLNAAWQNLVPAVRDMRSYNAKFLRTCHICPLVNLCLWCPAHSYLESGKLDSWIKYFCQVAHARAKMLGYRKKPTFLQEPVDNKKTMS